MKLTCTRIRQSWTIGNLSSCLCICKFFELNDEDYQQIFQMANVWGLTNKANKTVSSIYVNHNYFFCSWFSIKDLRLIERDDFSISCLPFIVCCNFIFSFYFVTWFLYIFNARSNEMLCYIADLDVWMIFAFGFLTLFYMLLHFS